MSQRAGRALRDVHSEDLSRLHITLINLKNAHMELALKSDLLASFFSAEEGFPLFCTRRHKPRHDRVRTSFCRFSGLPNTFLRLK